MPKKKKRALKKSVILSALLVLVIAGSGLLVYRHGSKNHMITVKIASADKPVYVGKEPYNVINYGKTGPSDNSDTNIRKSNPSSAATTLDNGPTTSSPSGSSSYVTVTNANSSGSNLVIGTLLSSGITSGTCVASVSQSGQTTVTSSAVNVELVNNSYECQNIDIPLSDFSSGGSWNVSVSVTYSGGTVTGNWADNPVSLGS